MPQASGGCRRAMAMMLSFALVAGAGCTTTGPSPREIKTELQGSFLYKGIGMFADGSTSGPFDATGPVSAAQRDAIAAEYARIVKLMLATQQREAAQLKLLFPSFDAQRARVRVNMPDRGLDAPTIAVDGSISVDIKVARLMFRDSVLAAMRSTDLGSPGFMDGWSKYCGAKPATDAQYLQCFLGLKARIDRIQPKSVVGSLLSKSTWELDDEDDGSYFFAADLLIVSQSLLARYAGLLFFVTAHEIAHVALGHVQQMRAGGMRDAAALRAAEYQADAFAVALMAYATPELALFEGMGMSGVATGFEDFFTLTYRNARWTEGADSHPPSAARLAAARNLYAAIRDKQVDAFSAELVRQIEAAQP